MVSFQLATSCEGREIIPEALIVRHLRHRSKKAQSGFLGKFKSRLLIIFKFIWLILDILATAQKLRRAARRYASAIAERLEAATVETIGETWLIFAI